MCFYILDFRAQELSSCSCMGQLIKDYFDDSKDGKNIIGVGLLVTNIAFIITITIMDGIGNNLFGTNYLGY